MILSSFFYKTQRCIPIQYVSYKICRVQYYGIAYTMYIPGKHVAACVQLCPQSGANGELIYDACYCIPRSNLWCRLCSRHMLTKRALF